MARHSVALQCLDRGVRCDQARRNLADALEIDDVPAHDEGGVFEVGVDAEDFEGALARVWDAIAASGSDDHVAFAEHPDIPEHWRRRDGGDGLPGALT
jgi:hypothetical protein